MSVDVEDLSEGMSEVVSVIPPGSKKPIYLRYPSFGEWYEVAAAHNGLEGRPPAAELITKTLSICLCDESGKRIAATPSESKKLLECSPKRVMWIYRKCWETVLKNDDAAVEEVEKN